MKWKEEVKLSTGEVVTVIRETRFRFGGGEILRNPGWRPAIFVLSFRYPPGSKTIIDWQTTKWEPTRWGTEAQSYPEQPLVLDYDQARKEFYVISRHVLVGSCHEYVRYYYRDGRWVEDALPEEFAPLPANLFVGVRLDMPRHVKLDFKNKENANTRYSLGHRQVGPKRYDCLIKSEPT